MKCKDFIVLKALNHNALLCEAVQTKKQYVFFGKGIGFKKGEGDEFKYTDNVKESLLVLSSEESLQYNHLINMVDNKKLVDLVQDLVYEANKFFDGKVNAKLNLTLLDHLNFALERQKNKIVMNYPFLNELQFIYPKEYKFSLKAFNYLNDQLKGTAYFEEAELGFLVLHIHAAITDTKVSKVLLNNEILYEATKIIEDSVDDHIDRKSIYYSRFTKHLEYAIQRYKNGIQLQNILLDNIKDTCKTEYEIAHRINSLLKRKYRIDLDENEIGYLTLHIYYLRNRKNQY